MDVRGYRIDGQLDVTDPERADADAGVARQQLEHLAPTAPGRAVPDESQGVACVIVASERLQRERHTCQAEVKRGVRDVIETGGQGVSAAANGVAVPRLVEVRVGFVKREQDSGLPVVERSLRPVSPVLVKEPIDRAAAEALKVLRAIARVRALHTPNLASQTPAGRPRSAEEARPLIGTHVVRRRASQVTRAASTGVTLTGRLKR